MKTNPIAEKSWLGQQLTLEQHPLTVLYVSCSPPSTASQGNDSPEPGTTCADNSCADNSSSAGARTSSTQLGF